MRFHRLYIFKKKKKLQSAREGSTTTNWEKPIKQVLILE